MSREFAITTPSASLTLDRRGHGEAVFTVTNTTATHMRAKATVVPLDAGLKPEWVGLRGARAREMPPGSTEVFTVDVRVPPGTPPGTLTFRLVVADVALPDERFTEGPAHAVTVPPPAAPAPRGFPGWLLVLGALVVLGGAVAAFLALRGNGEEPPAPTCPPGQTRCGEQCVDVRSDAAHCGACGTACEADFACREGQCVRTGCPGGQALCDGACVDTREDERHCGACGRQCPAHLTCREGRCLCPEASQRDCGGQCVDTRADERHCGLCNKRCAPGQSCQDGVCRCGSGQTLCGGACVNLQTSEQHCGSCGKRCAPNADCRSGRCVPRSPCPIAGQILCPCTGTCLTSALCAKRCQQDVQPF